MAKLPASLFNDVIGPVMRGPSSSHVAGAARIGALVRQSLGGDVRSVLVEFDVNGSLAESYHGHGSDIGFVSGLLDIDLTDPRVPEACAIAKREGVEVTFSILDYGASHPNNYRIAATGGDGRTLHWEAISVGGANMALAGFDKVIPLDETIAAVYDVGLMLPLDLRCTLGGLGKTPASFAIRKRLS